MAETATAQLADLQVAHAVGAMRFSESQAKQVYKLLQEASMDLERQIYSASTAISKERLTRLLGAVERYREIRHQPFHPRFWKHCFSSTDQAHAGQAAEGLVDRMGPGHPVSC